MPGISRAKIIDVQVINDNLRQYTLRPEKYVNYEPGQFLQLTLENVTASDYWPESRTFSIASYKPEEKTISVIINRVGEYTEKMFDSMDIGSEVTIKYPYGDFTLPVFDNNKAIICIAGGTGVTPFLSFVDALERKKELDRLILLYSVKYTEDIIEYEILKDKMSSKNLKIFTTQEKCLDAINRRIDKEDIIDYCSDYREMHYYISGSKEFITHYKNILENENLKFVYTDEWE